MNRKTIFLCALIVTGIYVFFVNAANTTDPLKDLIIRADNGEPEALYTLATLYDRGYDSIPIDSARSTELYRKAAEAGFLPAMNYLGYRLLSGEYSQLDKNSDEGLQWLEKAAINGDAKAASNLGWLLTEGKYVKRDYEKALFWLKKAADSQLPVAQSLLGDLMRDGLGTDIDSLAADSLYREAFENGLTDAAYKLADLEKNALDTLTDDKLVKEGKYYYLRSAPSIGVKLFYKAADQGNAEAMALLGDAYTRAIGVPYDHDLSLKYYAMAAQAGNPSAQFVIGELLEIFPDAFDSMDKDEIQILNDPLHWYEQAAAGGVTDAETATLLLLTE